MYPTTGAVTGWDAEDLSWSVGIKNGHHQLIHSFSCEINNSSVAQLVPYTNLYVSYKLMTSLSANELHTVAKSIGFYPDTPDSFNFNSSASYDGKGVSNCRVFGFEKLYPNQSGQIIGVDTTAGNVQGAYTNGDPVDFAYLATLPTSHTTITSANFGLYQRCKMLAFDPDRYTNFITSASCGTLLKNYYYTNSGGTTNTNAKVWQYIARIRLKDLHDVFDKLGLVRGLYMRFILNLNICTATIAITNSAGTTDSPTMPKMNMTALTASAGTCPFMVSSTASGQPNWAITPYATGNVDTATIKVQNAIGQLTYTANSESFTINHSQRSVRLYAPLISLNIDAEQQYLRLNPQRRIVYKDIYQYTITNIASDGTINNLLTNGLADTKTLIIIPIFNATSNGGLGYNPLQSVFATEPGTTSPLCALTNYNVQLAGVSLYQSNFNYDWESFNNELQSINAVNGGLTTGFSSGLIDEYAYSMTYRYYVTDLSRRIAAEDRVPKSIQVLGTNLSEQAVDYYSFVEVERELVIDLSSGARLE